MANYKKWNEAELQYIRDNVNNFNDLELAHKLSAMTGETISQSMVRRQRRKLSLKKSRGRPRSKPETQSPVS